MIEDAPGQELRASDRYTANFGRLSQRLWWQRHVDGAVAGELSGVAAVIQRNAILDASDSTFDALGDATFGAGEA